MHVVFRESHGLEETDTPQDLGQSPADLVVLSFSDSDLGAFAAGYHRAKTHGFEPSVRLANLVALKHPLSVDTYAEQTLAGAKAVLVKLIGGESYWPYGLATLREMADRQGLALAILPADGRPDPRLDELSTLPVSTLRRLQHLCDAGGAVAAHAALAQLALAAGLYAGPVVGEKTVPDFGFYRPGDGVLRTFDPSGKPLVPVTFYRSYLTAADTDPVDAILEALDARGFEAVGIFANSLKAPAAADWLRGELARLAPAAIVNATAFSAQGADGKTSPLSEPGCPVFQVALSTARRRDWAEAERGLSPADLAMHVVLPEVDGRIFGGVASFKQPGRKDPDLQYSRFAHRADTGRIANVVDRVAAWHRLATLPAADKRLALVLSTYPGRDWNLAHAVGLDPLASVAGLLTALSDQGHDLGDAPDMGKRLLAERVAWPLADYRAALDTLPDTLRADLFAAWGLPEADPDVQGNTITFAAIRTGNALIALQPERGEVQTRDDDYHDLGRTPRHGYVAFYLWLRAQTDALIHMGAHGTLEW
ncbi:MAG: cobaltochelatase subunit CobN, partial [Nioella sp.]